MATNELREIRRSLGKLLKIHTQVTATGGSTTTIVSATLSDYFPAAAALRGLFAHKQATSQWRRVTTYNATTFTATVNRAYGATIANGDVIDLYAVWNPDELDRALTDALQDVYPYLANTIVDTSLTTLANTYEYTIPSTIRDLHREWGAKVELQRVTSIATFPYDPVHDWYVRDSSGTRKLVFPDYLPVGFTLRLTGYAPFTLPTTETGTIALTDEQIRPLLFKAAAILFLGDVDEDAQSRAFNQSQAQVYEAKYQEAITRVPTLFEPGSIRNPSAVHNIGRGEIAEYAEPS